MSTKVYGANLTHVLKNQPVKPSPVPPVVKLPVAVKELDPGHVEVKVIPPAIESEKSATLESDHGTENSR
jgi:hypothetical protein